MQLWYIHQPTGTDATSGAWMAATPIDMTAVVVDATEQLGEHFDQPADQPRQQFVGSGQTSPWEHVGMLDCACVCVFLQLCGHW
ncbi:unnamed protein product [Protopolystoma xenopodis]|uniref:Uncharacterized protein n=1 Tax=Protopolystoma xenopodis TaxID=117903 RepID=A0A3S5FEK0_9PLAT|nr:unnamed protein product [Protopolystoma xenopodis]